LTIMSLKAIGLQ